ncbi:2Fe-2S iron-sulfur cluster binding domain-containing protein [Pseudocolwellia sp. HL-MZ19]|uniref:2Fe-2S iron-sulfur cluster binding domain-containing protein n=1 Tax=Pseudocolwellia sp. HL-MZ19 TaxID=3400846 RepID=UPI003CEC62D5
MSFIIEVDGETFNCPKEITVLLAMKNSGFKHLPVGCCAGGCGICKVRIIEGSYNLKIMSRAKVSIEEEKEGIALACRILPTSDLKIERIITIT